MGLVPPDPSLLSLRTLNPFAFTLLSTCPWTDYEKHALSSTLLSHSCTLPAFCFPFAITHIIHLALTLNFLAFFSFPRSITQSSGGKKESPVIPYVLLLLASSQRRQVVQLQSVCVCRFVRMGCLKPIQILYVPMVHFPLKTCPGLLYAGTNTRGIG